MSRNTRPLNPVVVVVPTTKRRAHFGETAERRRYRYARGRFPSCGAGRDARFRPAGRGTAVSPISRSPARVGRVMNTQICTHGVVQVVLSRGKGVAVVVLWPSSSSSVSSKPAVARDRVVVGGAECFVYNIDRVRVVAAVAAMCNRDFTSAGDKKKKKNERSRNVLPR